jgi:hypothetical protein
MFGDSPDGLNLRYRLCGVVPNACTVATLCPRSSSLADGEEPVLHALEWVWQGVEFNAQGVTARVSRHRGSRAV